MTNLRTDEIVFLCNLTKIGTDENKAIYSTMNNNFYIGNASSLGSASLFSMVILYLTNQMFFLSQRCPYLQESLNKTKWKESCGKIFTMLQL